MVLEITWYITFISIVFGVFISVWVTPLEGKAISDAVPPKTFQHFLLLSRGVLTFLLLICLWWWYAIFLGNINPATGFLMYVFEFTTLAFFAVGFRYWDHPILFPSAVLIGATLMLLRFIFIVWEGLVDVESKEWSALIIAIGTLVVYIVFILGAFAVTFVARLQVEQRLSIVHNVVTFLLFVGIVATMLAVDKAEGFAWGKPLVIGESAEGQGAAHNSQ